MDQNPVLARAERGGLSLGRRLHDHRRDAEPLVRRARQAAGDGRAEQGEPLRPSPDRLIDRFDHGARQNSRRRGLVRDHRAAHRFGVLAVEPVSLVKVEEEVGFDSLDDRPERARADGDRGVVGRELTVQIGSARFEARRPSRPRAQRRWVAARNDDEPAACDPPRGDLFGRHGARGLVAVDSSDDHHRRAGPTGVDRHDVRVGRAGDQQRKDREEHQSSEVVVGASPRCSLPRVGLRRRRRVTLGSQGILGC